MVTVVCLKGHHDEKPDKDFASMKVPSKWNSCCKRQFLRALCMAIDCTESVRPIKEMKGKEGGIEIIKKLCIISIGVFTRTENNAFTDVVEEGYKLLSRIDVMNNDEHGKVLKQMMAAQRKRYTRNFGGSRIDRFAKSGYDANGGHERRRSGSRSSTMTKIKPGVFSVGCVDVVAFLNFGFLEYEIS